MATYILSIHQKTAGTRVAIIDRKADVVASAYATITQHFPQMGWVEHDANEIWRVSMEVVAEALKNGRIAPEQIDAIGITNQRDTTVFWNRKTGEPVGRAVVWQDQRTVPICEQLIAGDKAGIETRTGMIIVPDVTAAKIRWLMDNDHAIQKGIARGEILCGTIDSWLIWKLSGGTAHVTDHSNASLTLLLNAHTLTYDDEMLSELGIPREILPELCRSSDIYASTDPAVFLGARVPIAGMAGDQQIAALGQACVEAGMAKNTYSSGSFMNLNTGSRYLPPADGLFSPVLWTMGTSIVYGLEGKANMAGDAMRWLQEGLGIVHELGEAAGHRIPATPHASGNPCVGSRLHRCRSDLGKSRTQHDTAENQQGQHSYQLLHVRLLSGSLTTHQWMSNHRMTYTTCQEKSYCIFIC